MTSSNNAVSLIQTHAHELNLRWVNTGRVGDDWKAKIFESARGPRQFAIYNTKSVIQVLLEKRINPVAGTWLHNISRPKSDALNDSGSRFSQVPGTCYRAGTEASFLELIRSYLSVHQESSANQEPLAFSLPSESQARALRLERLKDAPKYPERTTVQTTVFVRNQDVIDEVLFRANGMCEICASPAPFVRASNGEPYLEVHHIVPLAQNGEDTVENAVAACPNCHRRAHHG